MAITVCEGGGLWDKVSRVCIMNFLSNLSSFNRKNNLENPESLMYISSLKDSFTAVLALATQPTFIQIQDVAPI